MITYIFQVSTLNYLECYRYILGARRERKDDKKNQTEQTRRGRFFAISAPTRLPRTGLLTVFSAPQWSGHCMANRIIAFVIGCYFSGDEEN